MKTETVSEKNVEELEMELSLNANKTEKCWKCSQVVDVFFVCGATWACVAVCVCIRKKNSYLILCSSMCGVRKNILDPSHSCIWPLYYCVYWQQISTWVHIDTRTQKAKKTHTTAKRKGMMEMEAVNEAQTHRITKCQSYCPLHLTHFYIYNIHIYIHCNWIVAL